MARSRRTNMTGYRPIMETKLYKIPSHTKQYVYTPVGYKDHTDYKRTLELRDIMERINLRGKVHSEYTDTPVVYVDYRVSAQLRMKCLKMMRSVFAYLSGFVLEMVPIRKQEGDVPKRSIKINYARAIPILGCLIMFAVGATQIIDYVNQTQTARETNAYLQEIYYSATFVPVEITPTPTATPEPSYMPSVVYVPEATPRPTLAPEYQVVEEEISSNMTRLKELNNDFIGWINISGVVDLPVVYRDNDYYLYRDFYGDSNKAGTLFLDENHPFNPETQYMVIHGHNMDDGSMFGLVLHYWDINYVYQHGFMNFSTLYQNEKYVVFAVLRVSTDSSDDAYVPYLGISQFQSESQFDYFVDLLVEHSLYDIPVDVDPSDALIALSTCWDDDRLVVVFRRVREDESTYSLQKLLNQSVEN